MWLGVGCNVNPTVSIGAMATPTTSPIFQGDNEVSPTDSTNSANGSDNQTAEESEIHSIRVSPGNTSAMITWALDDPAIGSLAYGLTESYELGMLGSDLPLTRHAIMLGNLDPETTYYYQITAVDSQTSAIIAEVEGSFETGSLAPTLEVWYGTHQTYGNMGTAQQWFNILGNVSDQDGIASLAYTLNGGPKTTLSIGPDLRRLAQPGDFNVDIHRTDLSSGENEVVITAIDTLGNEKSVTVTIDYQDDTVWPGDYSIDWQTVTNIQDVAQVVDGLWQIDNGEVRPETPSYDRLIAIGDISWTDYEVVVPITLHSIDLVEGFSGNSNGPGLGLIVRWAGHTDIPVLGWQPKAGWEPFGAIAWHRWESSNLIFLRLEGPEEAIIEKPVSIPSFGVPYFYKVRVETLPDGASLYQFKVWPDGQTEPEAWDLSGELSGLPNGSLLLLAHQVDASFGKVTITQLAPPTLAPELPNKAEDGYFTVTTPITSSLPISGTVPVTGTIPITGTTSISGTVPVTETSSVPLFTTSTELCLSIVSCSILESGQNASVRHTSQLVGYNQAALLPEAISILWRRGWM